MKATLVYANGRIEETSYGGGDYVQKTEQVVIPGKGGQSDKSVHVKRIFKAVKATNANTVIGGEVHEGAWGPVNDGVVVLVEQPDFSHCQEKPKPVEEKTAAPIPPPPAVSQPPEPDPFPLAAPPTPKPKHKFG